MTVQTDHELPSPVQAPEQPVLVTPTGDSRLAQLHARYAETKAAAEAAAAAHKEVTDGIKLALAEAAPNERRVELTGPDGPALRLVYSERISIDTKAIKPVLEQIKTIDPEKYKSLHKISGSWSLSPVKGGGQ